MAYEVPGPGMEPASQHSQDTADPIVPQRELLQVLLLYLTFFCLFRAAHMAYGGSQVGSQIGAVAAGLYHSHSNTRSMPPSVTYIPQLVATLDP